MSSKKGICILAALLLFSSLAAADAVSVSLVPSVVGIYPFDNFAFDVRVSGLQSGGTKTLLGAFDLTISFDPNFLTFRPTQSTFGSALGDSSDPAQTLIGKQTNSPGNAEMFEVSLLEASSSTCIFCTGPYLEDLQSNTFRLGTIAFLAHFPASFQTTQVTLMGDLSDADGNLISNTSFSGALVVSVPEPASVTMCLAGIVLVIRKARCRK